MTSVNIFEFYRQFLSDHAIFVTWWMVVGMLTRAIVLIHSYDRGNDVSLFDIVTIAVCALYGPMYAIFAGLIYLSMKADSIILAKKK